ncbi:hypothetical protein TRIUR3_05987 [Triticum urartu]|uniref:Uncharacterized protein n=1 Tax=Triticum urartu TaxID=4572 RepID=M7Z5Z4_TRIUA|nr:hypothetical protein TRIUR3_05987 [Triticum urartu]
MDELDALDLGTVLVSPRTTATALPRQYGGNSVGASQQKSRQLLGRFLGFFGRWRLIDLGNGRSLRPGVPLPLACSGIHAAGSRQPFALDKQQSQILNGAAPRTQAQTCRRRRRISPKVPVAVLYIYMLICGSPCDACIVQYFGVSGYMFMAAVIVASIFWPDWQDSLTTAIVFSYSTAMILLLLKHWDSKEDQPARRCHESTWVQMLVVTGIMLISLVLMVSIFPNKWDHVAMIVFVSLVAAAFSFLLLNVWDAQHEWERAQAASAGFDETSTDLA